MKFLAPILQGIIVLVVVSLLGWGIQAYGQFERFDERLRGIEQQLVNLNESINTLPLCRQ